MLGGVGGREKKGKKGINGHLRIDQKYKTKRFLDFHIAGSLVPLE